MAGVLLLNILFRIDWTGGNCHSQASLIFFGRCPEEVEGTCESFLEAHLGRPSEDSLGLGDVRAATHGVVWGSVSNRNSLFEPVTSRTD